MSHDVVLTVSRDEALVLFEMLSRFSKTNHLSLCHNSEFIALSSISGQLDKALPEPFLPNYSFLLSQAQSSVASGYEGLAPSVVPETYTESIECVASPDEGVLFVKVVGMPQGYPVEFDVTQARELAARVISAVEQVEAGWVGKSSS